MDETLPITCFFKYLLIDKKLHNSIKTYLFIFMNFNL